LRSGQPVVVGRDATCDVVVPSGEASRAHAEIRCVGEELSIRDLKSLNGTFVNGQSISKVSLKSGDVLRIGDRLGVVNRLVAPSESGATVQAIARGLWAGPTLQRALEPLRTVAKTDLPILLQGATGVGKERVARALHEWSGRSGAFVAINCAAIPEQLAEAELFGYRKGAFTGAEQNALGHLRAAHRGTLLLDEIADLPLRLQAKLLRVVEENEVQPIGEAKTTPIDVRIVATSQMPLSDHVADGRFRADLYARLAGLIVALPTLADRREEIPGLFCELLASRLSSPAPELQPLLVESLMLYSWPGNVRELALLTRRLLGLHGHEGRLEARHLAGSSLQASMATGASNSAPSDDTLSDKPDLDRLLEGLREHRGNLTKAAGAAKISRQRAYRLLETRSDLDLGVFRKEGPE
jgi:transcriptional regulator with PAS, ATPase and Fis domain